MTHDDQYIVDDSPIREVYFQMSSEQKIMMLDPLEMSNIDFRDERKI